MFVILDDVREAARARSCTARRSPPSCASEFAAEVPEADVDGASGRRRCAASAGAGGFKLMVEDRGDLGPGGPAGARPTTWSTQADEQPGLVGAVHQSSAPTSPQLFVDVDRDRVPDPQGVPLARRRPTRCRSTSGSLYVNDFNQFGRTWQVIVQADAAVPRPGRGRQPAQGPQQPRADGAARARVAERPARSTARWSSRATTCTRPPPINGNAAPGRQLAARRSTLMEQLAEQRAARSDGLRVDRADLPASSRRATPAMIVFGFAVVIVFLVLAAQYESWSLPLAVILVVPMCLLSSIVGVWIAKQDINIFTQIGFVVLVGLASKNAILIVEFAKQSPRRGRGPPRGDPGGVPAAAAADHDDVVRVHPRRRAAGLRHGAGAEMRQTLGTAVFSGMLGVTLFGIFLTPVFFYVIDCLGESALFRSPLVRGVSGFAIGMLSLRPARELVRRMAAGRPALAKPSPARTPKPEPLPEPRRAGRRARRAYVRGIDVLEVLHRPADLRLGAVDRHHPGRRHRRLSRCRSRSTPRSRRRRSRCRPSTPGPTPRSSPTPSPRPIEQQVNGVEDMMYMSSQCTNDGTYTLTVTFKPGIDLNMAQVLVQNRVAPGPADPARPGQAPRRDGQEEVAQHADDRQPVLARRHARQPVPEQLRDDPAPRRAGAGCPASATSPTSASATTACASGSTPRRWRPAT